MKFKLMFENCNTSDNKIGKLINFKNNCKFLMVTSWIIQGVTKILTRGGGGVKCSYKIRF